MLVMALYCQCQNGEAVQALLLMVFLASMMGGLDKTILCSVANSFGSSEEACDILSCDLGIPRTETECAPSLHKEGTE